MSIFTQKLRKAMYDKHCKAADIAKSTGINPSILSRYLSGANKPSSDNIIAISHYLNVSPEWLLSSSDGSESIQRGRGIPFFSDKDKIIGFLEMMLADKDKQIDYLTQNCDTLAKEVQRLTEKKKAAKAKSKKSTPYFTKARKQKVGFLKKHKSKK